VDKGKIKTVTLRNNTDIFKLYFPTNIDYMLVVTETDKCKFREHSHAALMWSGFSSF
jgi:hypothetical protein